MIDRRLGRLLAASLTLAGVAVQTQGCLTEPQPLPVTVTCPGTSTWTGQGCTTPIKRLRSGWWFSVDGPARSMLHGPFETYDDCARAIRVWRYQFPRDRFPGLYISRCVSDERRI